ncbi:DUF6292 family protein [Streptomyces sp. HUAS ZL42]|uniref:DUF6292 family protein n=1 Tax=Streptomyces sp. HUAS ZL42 TaxID=3231715 RepID=UPI00345EABC7
MDAAGLQRGRLTALALEGEDLVGADQIATQISLDGAREARLVAEAAIDRVRDKFGASVIGPAAVFRRASRPDPLPLPLAEVRPVLPDPPGWPGRPQKLPHWPYVKAVDEALAARGIAPGIVRADVRTRQRGLTTYMLLRWDASRTGGRGGIRLQWEERRGWFYALLGLGPHDVLLHTVLSPIETIYAAPDDLAEVAQELVRHRRLPDARYRQEWNGAQHGPRRRHELPPQCLWTFPCRVQDGSGDHGGGGRAADHRHPEGHLRAGDRGRAGRVRAQPRPRDERLA